MTNSRRTEELHALLHRRILILDGAMGTMIQRYGLDEAAFRGEAFRESRKGPERRQRPALDHAAADHRGDPPAVLRGRRGHRRDEHVQRDVGLDGRVRPRAPRLRHQRRRGPGRARGGRCGDGEGPFAPALRRGVPRPDQQDRVPLARRQQPRVPRRHVRPAPRRVLRAGARARRRRRRHPHPRDHVRHAEPQGGALRDRAALPRPRRPPSRHGLGDDHRSLRAHALGPDRRGVLGFGVPRPDALGRAQLRSRRGRDAPLRRRALAPRSRVFELLPQCGTAERARRLRRDARVDGEDPPGVRRGRVAEHRGGVLRDHARSHPRDRGGSARHRSAEAGGAVALPAPLRARAADRPRGLELHRHRRADERHRLAEVQEADLRRRHGRRSPRREAAGRGRRQHPRRQHGRGAARLREGDGRFPQPPRRGARDREAPDHGRLLALERHRGGAEASPGEIGRQLDLPQGRGREVQASRRAW